MFIVLEGLDGSGKSTVSRKLAASLGAQLCATPPAEYRPIREKIDRSNSRHAQLYFYLSSVFYASSHIEAWLAAGKTVVCDRYIHTTLAAYSDLLESTYPGFWRCAEDLMGAVVKPDFVFFLNVSDPQVREQRIVGRGFVSQNDTVSLYDKIIFARTMHVYKRFNLIEIETSNRNADEVTALIEDYITVSPAARRNGSIARSLSY